MGDRSFNLLIWAAASAVAAWAALLWFPATLADGSLVPSTPDAFYHARRILDAYADPGAFYEFDPRLNAPYGSWLSLPWGFDLGAAWLLRLTTWLLPGVAPERVLALLPSAWVLVNAALLLGVASALGLGRFSRAAALACFAVSPLTQSLHAAGRIEHHFLEYTMVLATLYLGLSSAGDERRGLRTLLWGVLLGFAPAVHAPLFILQIPVLAWAVLVWLRDRAPGDAFHLRLVVGLLAGTALAVAPSQAARELQFAFNTLSWFQVYVSCCTALIVLLTARLRSGPRSLTLLLVVAALLAVPLLEQAIVVHRFMSIDYPVLEGIQEMLSPLLAAGDGGPGLLYSLRIYSGLLIVFPVVLAALAWRVLRSGDRVELLFALAALFGGTLLLLQLRLQYFGSFALYLPLLLGVQALTRRFDRHRRSIRLSAALLLALAYAPGIEMLVRQGWPSPYYQLTRGVYPGLAGACSASPGVVLADHTDGHFIRFHTECSVIGSLFGLTPEDHRAIERGRRLMRRSAAWIREHEPWIDYVFVVREDNVLNPPEEAEIRRLNAGLREELLLSGDAFPEGYRLLSQTQFRDPRGTLRVVARAFRIERGDPARR